MTLGTIFTSTTALSTHTLVASTTNTSTTVFTPSTSSGPSAPPSQTSILKKEPNRTGPIAGSVVGGLGALAIMAVVAYRIRKKLPRRPSAAENAVQSFSMGNTRSNLFRDTNKKNQGDPPVAAGLALGWSGLAEIH